MAATDSTGVRWSKVGTATAVTALAREGITYRPGRTSGRLIANSDACTLLTDSELAAVSGLNRTIRSPGFANWSCVWAPHRPPATPN